MSTSKLAAVRLWPWLLSLLILLPVLRPGFVLSYDMVFVPDLAFRSDFLGLGSSLPRAVPSDTVVALLDEVLRGDVLQKVVLFGALGLAGTGARRLVQADRMVAQLAATSLYLWSPVVAERLGIGHWPLLLTYATLPWIYDAARRSRAGESRTAAIVLWMGLASLSPVGGVIAALFGLCCVAGRDRVAVRRALIVAVAAAAVNAPWIVAGALHGSGALSDPRGVEAFAARGEGLLPLPLTLLGLGGIWNVEVVPPSRSGWAAVVWLVLALGVGALGVRRWRSSAVGLLVSCDLLRLGVAALIGLSLALVASLFPGIMGELVSTVPGGGLLRDGARFVILLAPLAAGLFGTGTGALADLVEERAAGAARMAVASAVVLAPIALMPDLAWGLGGRLHAVDYPTEYSAARLAIEERQDTGVRGNVLLLPFSSYRLPRWNDGRRTLDPLGRFMTPNYLGSDVLYVSGAQIAGEDARAARVAELLEAKLATRELADDLGNEGIAWVLVDKEAAAMIGDAAPSADLDGQRVVHDGARLVVWEVPRTNSTAPSVATKVAVAVAWGAAGAAMLASAGLLGARLLMSRRKSSRSGVTGW